MRVRARVRARACACVHVHAVCAMCACGLFVPVLDFFSFQMPANEALVAVLAHAPITVYVPDMVLNSTHGRHEL